MWKHRVAGWVCVAGLMACYGRASDPKDGGADGPHDAAAARPHEIYAADECPRRLLSADLMLMESTHPAFCRSGADCTRMPNGFCEGREQEDGTILFAYCAYDGCTNDSQCGEGERCECSFYGQRQCLRIECEGDDDCDSGQRCERSMTSCYYKQLGHYVCTTPEDECVTHQDCSDGLLGDWCYLGSERRTCWAHTCE